MKVCKCKINFIREEVESIAGYDSCVEAITKIVESDCICMKSNKDCKVQCALCGEPIVGRDGDKCFSCSEKPNNCQSLCEHNNPGKIWSYWTEGSMTLYGCQKCGLITCKNPNE